MPTLSTDAIKALPEYQELIKKRKCIARPLTVIMLLAYYIFVLMVAYAPETLSIKLADGVTSVGIVMGLGLIILTFAITGIYVWYANSKLEDLIIKIQQKAGAHE